jgi:hypothetical protein
MLTPDHSRQVVPVQFPTTGYGIHAARSALSVPFTDPELVAVADFNNDGRADTDGLIG